MKVALLIIGTILILVSLFGIGGSIIALMGYGKGYTFSQGIVATVFFGLAPLLLGSFFLYKSLKN